MSRADDSGSKQSNLCARAYKTETEVRALLVESAFDDWSARNVVFAS